MKKSKLQIPKKGMMDIKFEETDIPKPPELITQEMLDYYSIPIVNKDYLKQVNKIFNYEEIPKSKVQKEL